MIPSHREIALIRSFYVVSGLPCYRQNSAVPSLRSSKAAMDAIALAPLKLRDLRLSGFGDLMRSLKSFLSAYVATG